MRLEPQNDYERILAQALRLDQSSQKNLIADLTTHLNRGSEVQPAAKNRGLMELKGLFTDIWPGQDAQEYVNQERAAWAKRDEEREKELWGG